MKDKVIKDAMSSIKNIIRHVYDQGQEDGLNAGLYDSIIIDKDVYGQGYEKGLKDAWECARTIATEMTIAQLKSCGLVLDNGVDCDDEYDYSCWLIGKYSASEAISKIKEYNEKHKQSEDVEIKKIEKLGADINKDIKKSLDRCAQNLTSTKLFEMPIDPKGRNLRSINSSDNKEDDTYVYLYKGTFSQFKEGNSVLLSTDITYWDRNTHDDKVLKAGEIHTIKEYFPETGACLITVNKRKDYDEILNKDRCKKCPNDGKCRLCLTGINWDLLKEKGDNNER